MSHCTAWAEFLNYVMVRLGEDRSAIPAGFGIGFIDASLVAEQLLGLLVGIRQGPLKFAVTWGLASVYLTIEDLLGVDLRVLVLFRASCASRRSGLVPCVRLRSPSRRC